MTRSTPAGRLVFSNTTGIYGVLILALLCKLQPSQGQDFSVLRINEVISNNESEEPTDSTDSHRDMVEIYNSGTETLLLGSSAPGDSLSLSDGTVQPQVPWTFPQGFESSIPPEGFLIVFLSNAPLEPSPCELHTGFGLSRTGTEPLTLWGPEEAGVRTPIDQVWLPPLGNDISFGRYPDGAGPAPVPLEDTLSVFHYYFMGSATFGSCESECDTDAALCTGEPNDPPEENGTPRVKRTLHSTNHPLANEAVLITAHVSDDKLPLPGNIAEVLLSYQVNENAPTDIPMVFDPEMGDSGILNAAAEGRPLDIWSVWTAVIPGQPEGTRVRFTLQVEDAEGLVTADPFTPCDEGVGPCNDLGLPGPDCTLEPEGLQFLSCSAPFEFVVGITPSAEFQGLVINEVVASQSNLLENPASPLMFDDFIEIHNTGADAVSLAGLWLSDKPFAPRGWQFPIEPDPRILPGEYLLVWLDNDGGKCPRPPKIPGDGQECPDPTSVPEKAYHTNFALNDLGDQIYIFDRERPAAQGGGFRFIHGVEFDVQNINVSLSLLPNGDRNGAYEGTPCGTAGLENERTDVSCFDLSPMSIPGDCNRDGAVDLSDVICLLGHLFQSSPESLPCNSEAAGLQLMDCNSDGTVDLSDAIYKLAFLFQGESPPVQGVSCIEMDCLPNPGCP